MLKHQLQQEQLQTLQLQHQQLLQHLKILKQPKPQQKLQVLAHVLQQILTLSDLLQTVVQHLTVLASDITNAGALATGRSRRRNTRALTDHNYEAVSVETHLKDGEKATPDMTDPNGATVRSQTVPSGYQAKEGDYYTYSIVDLTNFNKRYHTNYYTRAYKRFDASTDTTVELG